MSFLELPAIRVDQPLGSFFITKIKAKLLLEICYSNPLRIVDTSAKLLGSQREIQKKRINEISRYIQTVECAFPNSIILAANYCENGELSEDDNLRWRVENNDEQYARIIIPTNAKLGSIIDGQHRLNGFKYVEDKYKDIELLCAIYFDLPNPYQAYIFATINFNQKKVDRSLAYELFGYNLDNEIPITWSPEKFAVFLTRKLNLEKNSPFYNRIIVAAQDDDVIFSISPKKMNWYISTATIVDGILKLISTNPKRDRDLLNKLSIEEGRSREKLSNDNSPLRKHYIQSNDIFIFTVINNFFESCNKLIFECSTNDSYIIKTIGIQALFEVLKEILNKELNNIEIQKDISTSYFDNFVTKFKKIDFSNIYFKSASGIGKTQIKNIILFKLNYLNKDQLFKNKETNQIDILNELIDN